jgi:trehalose 6-phosphate phosphatase
VRGAAPERTGIFTDFDGTLSTIVEDPLAARPIPGAVEALAALAERYGRVAVVSGRPVLFLAEHLGVSDRLLLCGLYGLERMHGAERVTVPGAAQWRAAIETAVERALGEAPAGVTVEDKGLAMTVHFRSRPEAAAWAVAWAGNEAARSGLAVHSARRSVELRPPVDTDKGTVVRELLVGLDAACFVGDDIGDLPAFDAVHTVESGVAVAVRSAEAPHELLAAADLIVEGPEGALDFLTGLVDGHPDPLTPG